MVTFRAMSSAAPSPRTSAQILTTFVATLAEDAIFALSCQGDAETLEGFGKRRGEAYQALLGGHVLYRPDAAFDAWYVEGARAAAPVASPAWLPMSDVVREGISLHTGARGLRSLFSSKPSDKDIQRVKRLGSFTVRALRAVFAADGPVNAEEARTLSALIASFGLPDADAASLFAEAPLQAEQLDVYGDVEPAIAKAIVRGAWLAAATDMLDPREEAVVRTIAHKLNVETMQVEELRTSAVNATDARRLVGLAAVDAVRFITMDRANEGGTLLARTVGTLLLPKRFQAEAFAQLQAGTPLVLAKRYAAIAKDAKDRVLGIAWAAALFEDPSVSRRALLRARHERIALDLGDDGAKERATIDEWFAAVLAPAAFPMSGGL